MRTSDVDILIIPGWAGAGPDHWQTRWARNLRTARLVEQVDWDRPDRDAWVGRIAAAVEQATRPVVFAAHSCGASAVVHAAALLPQQRIAGAFLVAVPDLEQPRLFAQMMSDSGPHLAFPASFLPMPLDTLPFPAVLVASANDPFCTPDRASAFARAWGATLIDAGEVGHINTASGHGPWPEGLLRLGTFLRELGPPPTPA